MYRDGDGTSFRSGQSDEFVKTLDFKWVPHQVKAGDLVLIHDMVWHKSLPNNSNKSRNIFTWHLYNSGERYSLYRSLLFFRKSHYQVKAWLLIEMLRLTFINLEDSKWDDTCWLQYPEGQNFMTFNSE